MTTGASAADADSLFGADLLRLFLNGADPGSALLESSQSGNTSATSVTTIDLEPFAKRQR